MREIRYFARMVAMRETTVKKWLAVFGMLVPATYVLADTYTYDDLGRVKTVTSGSLVTTYTYDAADNRTSIQTAAPNTNHAPICTNQTTTMTGIPPMAGATVTITVSAALARCTDSDGDTMTILSSSPTLPYTFTIYSGQTRSASFTVSDGRGGTGSATITYTRP